MFSVDFYCTVKQARGHLIRQGRSPSVVSVAGSEKVWVRHMEPKPNRRIQSLRPHVRNPHKCTFANGRGCRSNCEALPKLPANSRHCPLLEYSGMALSAWVYYRSSHGLEQQLYVYEGVAFEHETCMGCSGLRFGVYGILLKSV